MANISNQIIEIINDAEKSFSKIPAEQWSNKHNPNKWSKKEILGHLIDSAINNHNRFIRAQYENAPVIVYDQNKWVALQNYQEADVENLIQLFINFNKHLAYILSIMTEAELIKLCDIKKENPVTLEWIAIDYVRHLKHHFIQII